MLSSEQFDYKEAQEDDLFQEREQFVRDNYPQESSKYEMTGLINNSLDGLEVLEQRGKNEEIEGIITYFSGKDHEDTAYCSIGIMLSRKDLQGEGIMRELLKKLKRKAHNEGAQYLVATADTEQGENFLLNSGFYSEKDPVNHEQIYRLDL